MKKHIKLFVFIASMLVVFFIYRSFEYKQSKINYIALGDSVAEGMNPYGNIGYGYPDYISDYLKDKNRLSFYTKGFSKSGYTTENLKNDIENNKTIVVDGKKISIKEALRESDLVTLSIGANDFIRGLSFSNFANKVEDIKTSKKEIDKIGKNIKDLILLIQDYAKKEVILIGYYNPFPRLTTIKSEIDELIKYSDYIYEDICNDLNITYVNISGAMEDNEKYLPNPLDIHPSISGYERIADEVIKKIK